MDSSALWLKSEECFYSSNILSLFATLGSKINICPEDKRRTLKPGSNCTLIAQKCTCWGQKNKYMSAQENIANQLWV